jgi:hypothetical protein
MSDAWKAVIEADLKDAEYTPSAPIPDGEYQGFVSNVVAKTFESKSKGLEVTFVVKDADGEGKNREIKDYLVIVLADGSFNKTGPAVAKKLMMECGLKPEEITKFKFPEFDKGGFGDFKKLLDEPLTIVIKSQLQKKGKNAGKSYPRVQNFKNAA